jgi:hypothetical protein
MAMEIRSTEVYIYLQLAREVVMEEKKLPAQVGMDTGVKYLFRC